MTKIRELALKLFAKVYGLKTATTYLVKKQFPKFRASLKDHWEFLILKLLKIYREQKAKQHIEKRVEALKDFCRMTDKQLKEEAATHGINPSQPRFKLLRELGVEPKKPETTLSLTAKRGRFIREWDGKLA